MKEGQYVAALWRNGKIKWLNDGIYNRDILLRIAGVIGAWKIKKLK